MAQGVGCAEVQQLVADINKSLFGTTSLEARLDDIIEEADELFFYESPENMKEETSDLLCSVISLIDEQGWTIEEMIKMYAAKLKHRKETGHYDTNS